MSRPFVPPEPVPVLVGPTGSGKSALAEIVAQLDTRVQLINTDAFQAYREVDIGTAKPANRAAYLLLDCQNPSQKLDAVQFAAMVRNAIADCCQAHRVPLLVGGNGFYLRVLSHPPRDPEAMVDADSLQALRARIVENTTSVLDEIRSVRPDLKLPHSHDHYRIEKAWLRSRAGDATKKHAPGQPLDYWGLWAAGPAYEDHLQHRVLAMLEQGWQAEAERVAERYGRDAPALRAIGYSTLLQRSRSADATAEIQLLTRRYAKRQRTWFRSCPVRWFPAASARTGLDAKPVQRLLQYMDAWYNRKYAH